MTKQVLYLYLGTNGTILSPIHLEDTYYVRKFKLKADNDKVLTDGKRKVSSIIVPEEEEANWREIPLVENE